MGVRKTGNVDVFLDADGLVRAIQLSGRVLYLTPDSALLKRQFNGENLESMPNIGELYAHVSTDAIIKANPDCYYYDDRLGTLVLRSLGGGGMVEPGDIRNRVIEILPRRPGRASAEFRHRQAHDRISWRRPVQTVVMDIFL